MKKFPLGLAVAAIVCFSTLISRAAGPPPAALKTFSEHEGFGGSPLQGRFGNHLFVNTVINGQRTALMIDSGCPVTPINRSSAHKLGLQVQETKKYIGGVTGRAERYGISNLASLAMGNCKFASVPVEVADEDQINLIARPHLDGFFGAHEMAKFGTIIDCSRQMIYVNPKGPSPATTQKLAQFLAGRGFVRIPMRFNPDQLGNRCRGQRTSSSVDRR